MPTLILRDDWKAVALQEILKGGILYKSHQKDLVHFSHLATVVFFSLKGKVPEEDITQ